MKLKLSKSSSYFTNLTLSLLLSLSVASEVSASPHHITLRSKFSPLKSNCIFPDGTSPTRVGTHCYQPKDFLKAYGIDKLHAMGITGKGQTIILADSFGSPTMQEDLDHFSETFGLPKTKIKFIYPNGIYKNDLADDDKSGWAEETTLDLEWAHAIAPDATLVNIVTDNSETVGLAGFPDLFKGIQMAIQQYPGSIISMSYGTGEPTFTPDDIKTYLQGSFHQIFKDANAAGITLLASTGDSGSTNLDAKQEHMIPFANAGYPASDPLVTAVGGTALEAGWEWTPEGTVNEYWACRLANTGPCPKDILSSSVSNIRRESVWKEDWAVAAGGGGVSTLFPAPSYQRGLGKYIRQSTHGQRALPDVSLNAAINGGVEIFMSFGKAGPSWQSTGGTSCAAPETAGLVALAGQRASDIAGRKISMGQINSLLYMLPSSDFNDIQSEKFGAEGQVNVDDNSIYYSPEAFIARPKSVPPVAVRGFTTESGYDLATGLGTPKAELFVLDLARAKLKLKQLR